MSDLLNKKSGAVLEWAQHNEFKDSIAAAYIYATATYTEICNIKEKEKGQLVIAQRIIVNKLYRIILDKVIE